MMLQSKTIRLRLINEDDAEFILGLRLDNKYNKFLSEIPDDISLQKAWIKNYKTDESNGLQFYFLIERLDGIPCGTVRVYDIRNDSFCWGSWILNDKKTISAALESAFLIYDFGFNYLGRDKSCFDVIKGNEKVVSFHRKMGAKKIGEDEKNYYFEVSKHSISRARNRFYGKLS